jgi:prophage endopeptidase
MKSLFSSPWMAIALFCIGLGTGTGVTSWGLSAHYKAQVTELQLDQERKVSAARADDIETLKLSQQHGDALTRQLQVTESTLTKKQKELHDAIRTQTTGRACLSGRTVSLLNNAGTAHASSDLPTPATGTAAADGATASDTAYASDQDIADWAANARTQHDICRARLDKLIDFFTSTLPAQ